MIITEHGTMNLTTLLEGGMMKLLRDNKEDAIVAPRFIVDDTDCS